MASNGFMMTYTLAQLKIFLTVHTTVLSFRTNVPALPALALQLIMSYQASNPGLGQGRDMRIITAGI